MRDSTQNRTAPAPLSRSQHKEDQRDKTSSGSSKSKPESFHFVEISSFGQSSREYERQLAKVRSHAAVVGHRRRREGASQVSDTSVDKIKKFTQKFRIETTSDRKPLQISPGYLRNQANLKGSSILSDYSCSPGLRIDPFYCLPGSREKPVAMTLDFCKSQNSYLLLTTLT